MDTYHTRNSILRRDILKLGWYSVSAYTLFAFVFAAVFVISTTVITTPNLACGVGGASDLQPWAGFETCAETGSNQPP